MGHPTRLELTRVGFLVEFANHYTTRGALTCLNCILSDSEHRFVLWNATIHSFCLKEVIWFTVDSLFLEEKIQIMLYLDPGNLLNQICDLIARCKHKDKFRLFKKKIKWIIK